jgi:hypothetical protein
MIMISEQALGRFILSLMLEGIFIVILSWVMFRWGRRYERRRMQEAFGRAIRERNARGDDLRFTVD